MWENYNMSALFNANEEKAICSQLSHAHRLSRFLGWLATCQGPGKKECYTLLFTSGTCILTRVERFELSIFSKCIS